MDLTTSLVTLLFIRNSNNEKENFKVIKTWIKDRDVEIESCLMPPNLVTYYEIILLQKGEKVIKFGKKLIKSFAFLFEES